MSEENFDNNLDFGKVLFLHINRTMQSTVNTSLFIFNIEAFEDVMSPYFDEAFSKKLNDQNSSFNNYNMLDPLLGQKDAIVYNKRLEIARTKFRMLMQLAEVKGLLLDRKGEGIDSDDDSEGYDNPEDAV